MNISGIPPPFGVPSCNCPTIEPCVNVIWKYPQKMAVLGVGAGMFGVFMTFGILYLFNNYNKIFTRMKRITSFRLEPIPENIV